MAKSTLITKLARWVLDFDASWIPQEIINLAKLSVLDSIGCALAALSEETAQNTLRVIDDLGGTVECTVIGTPMRTSVANAVLANGVLIRSLDFNDHLANDPTDGTKLGGHPSDCIATALSVGERQKNQGRDALVAIVMGYELFGRLQKLLDRERPWDHVTALGFVAPAVAGRLMALEEEKLAHALALSAAHCATLGVVRRGQLSAAKFMASPIVAQTGMLATLLAARGITGPLGVFEDERGLSSGVLPEEALSILTSPSGGKFMFEGVTIKAFPSLDTSQAAIAAALEMRQVLKSSLDNLEKIEVLMLDHPNIRKQIEDEDRRRPKSRETADHSIYFLVAVALLDGELSQRQFEGDRWFDPAVCALMDRITFRTDKSWNDRAPGGYPCTIRAVSRGGEKQIVEVPYAPGHPQNRLSAEGVEEKFHSCTKGVLDESRRSKIIRTVHSLDSQSSVDGLMSLLAAS